MKDLEEQAIKFIDKEWPENRIPLPIKEQWTELISKFTKQQVHQALDEAAEEIPIPINPKTIDDFQPDMTSKIMKRLYNEHLAAVGLRDSILKLKEKY